MIWEIYRTYFLMFRSPVKVCKVFGLNRYELWALLSLYYYLASSGRKIVGKRYFFDQLTGNQRHKIKFEGYIKGLLDRELIGCYEYISRPDSLCIGISEKGQAVIDYYNSSLSGLFDAFPLPTITKKMYVMEEDEVRYIKRSA